MRDVPVDPALPAAPASGPAPFAAVAATVAAPGGITSAERQRGLLFLGLASGWVGVAMAFQMGLNPSFMADIVGASGWQMGLSEAVRETCGITAFLVLAWLAGFAEPLVGAGMLVLLGAGLATYAFTHSYLWVVLLSLVWSQGLHGWMPLPNSMAMALAEPGRTGHRLGQIGAAGSVGALLGFTLALGLVHWGHVALQPLYLLGGLAALLAAAACLGIPRRIKTPGKWLVWRRAYGQYYLMCFLEGWRKQVFIGFAGYLLTKQWQVTPATMLLLFLLTQVINFLLFPRVGRLIDHWGERRTLLIYYSTMACFFAGYAFLPNRAALITLFVVDGAFFMLAMALTSYVRRIAPPSEHTAALSAGVAANHVAAVLMPLTGGLAWVWLGPTATFMIGAAAAVVSLGVALRVPRPGAWPVLPAAATGAP